jgi:hypothetical protein
MRADNGWYGHRKAIAAYCGIARRDRPIVGTLVHGWSHDHNPLGSLKKLRLPSFVWNERHFIQALENDENAVLIGAPFTYWLALLDLLDSQPPRGIGTTFVPTQGLGPDYWDHLKEFVFQSLNEFPPPYRLSVYHRDLSHVEQLRELSSRGIRLISNGQPSHPLFIDRLLSYLLSTEYVVSDHPCSQIFYGGLLGRRIFVQTDQRNSVTMRSGESAEFLGSVGQGSIQSSTFGALPQSLFTGPLSSAEAHALSRYELGADHLVSPRDLSDLVGFTGSRRLLGLLLRSGFQMLDLSRMYSFDRAALRFTLHRTARGEAVQGGAPKSIADIFASK